MRYGTPALVFFVLAACGARTGELDGSTRAEPAPGRLRGRVVIDSGSYTWVHAAFAEREREPRLMGCQSRCEPSPYESVNAGVIRVRLPAEAVDVLYDGTLTKPGYFPGGFSYSHPETGIVSVHGPGSPAFPPFDAEVGVLEPPVVLEPEHGSHVRADGSIRLRWQPRSDKPIVVRVSVYACVQCVFDPTLGSGEIPADVMKPLLDHPAYGPIVEVYVVNDVTVRAGDYPVHVEHWSGTTRFLSQ